MATKLSIVFKGEVSREPYGSYSFKMLTKDGNYKYYNIHESNVTFAKKLNYNLIRVVFAKSIDLLEVFKDCDVIMEFYEDDYGVFIEPRLYSIINCKKCNLVMRYLKMQFKLSYVGLYFLKENYDTVIDNLKTLYYVKKCNVLNGISFIHKSNKIILTAYANYLHYYMYRKEISYND